MTGRRTPGLATWTVAVGLLVLGGFPPPCASQEMSRAPSRLVTPSRAEVRLAATAPLALVGAGVDTAPLPALESKTKGALIGGLVGLGIGALFHAAFGGPDSGCGGMCVATSYVGLTAGGAFIGALIAAVDATAES